MNIFKNLLQRAALTAVLVAAPLAVSAETLKDTLRSAYNHSGLLHQNRALLRAADEDVAQAIAQLRPIISWTARYSYSNQPVTQTSASLSVNLQWKVYDFGRSQLGIAALKETVLGTRAALISIEQDVLLRAAASYFNYRRAVEFQRLRASNVRLIQQQLRAAKDRFEVGEITRTDVSLAEARLASARAALAGAEGGTAQAVAEFVVSVGRKPKSPRAPKSLPKVPSNAEKATAIARRAHPVLDQLQHSITASELQVQQARLATRPTISITAGITTDTVDGNGISRQAGVTATGPIYQGGQLGSIVRQATARRDASRAQLHVVRHQIDQQVQNAYVQLDVARATRLAGDRQIRAANTAFRGVREEAKLGSRTTLDVLNAEQELLDARNNRVSAVVDEQIAAYSILAAMGRLTARDLHLGVKTYDPAEYYNLVKDAPAVHSKQGQALDRVLKSVAGGN